MKKIIPVVIILILSITFLGLHNIDEKEELKPNMKEESNKFTIASYINGVPSSEMPNDNSNLFGYVKCYDTTGNEIDALGFVKYENNKWNVNIENITLSSKCNVYFIDPPAHWTTAEEGTLLKAIKDNNPVENTKTIPGKQINLPDEALLSGTIDDYGTSYYFRGNVQNNYVQFADKCWRIVRITGDGSIKLVLHNNDSNDCNINSNIQNYAKYDSMHYTAAFNGEEETYTKTDESIGYVYQTASGIGFMYGNPLANNYLDAQTNLHDSTILKKLKLWYDLDGTFTENQKYQLADVIWCNDKSVKNYNTGYGEETTINNAANRIFNAQTIKPSLTCIDTFLSNYTAYDKNMGNSNLSGYKIGLLTADEASFAGLNVTKNNSANFLYNNDFYWLLTPYGYEKSTLKARGIYINMAGRINTNYVNTNYGIRPSIALNYNVQATYDKTNLENKPAGSVDNPYIISV